MVDLGRVIVSIYKRTKKQIHNGIESKIGQETEKQIDRDKEGKLINVYLQSSVELKRNRKRDKLNSRIQAVSALILFIIK